MPQMKDHNMKDTIPSLLLENLKARPVVAGALLIAAGALLPQQSNAVLIGYEGFDTPGEYTAGADLVNGNGGDNWAGTWLNSEDSGAADALRTNTPGLDYTDGNATSLQTVQGGAYQTGGGSDRVDAYYRQFTLPAVVQPGDQFWISALINVNSGTHGWNITLDDDAVPSGSNGIGFGRNNFQGNVVTGIIQSNASGTLTPVDSVPAGVANFIVARISVNGTNVSGNPTVDVWANPDLDTDLSIVAVGAGEGTYSRSYGSMSSIQNISLFSHQSVDMVFDEIRIGTTMQDVMVSAIPEPSAMAALFAGAILFGTVVLRRRRG